VVGVLVGGDIGRRIDAGDQACVGQVLEFAPTGQRVQWVAGAQAVAVVPGQVLQRRGSQCRSYTIEQPTPQGWTRTTQTVPPPRWRLAVQLASADKRHRDFGSTKLERLCTGFSDRFHTAAHEQLGVDLSLDIMSFCITLAMPQAAPGGTAERHEPFRLGRTGFERSHSRHAPA
jgi:hypothetical protein